MWVTVRWNRNLRRCENNDAIIETDGNSSGSILAFNLFINNGFTCDWHSGSTYDNWQFINNTTIESIVSLTGNSTIFHGQHPTNTVITNCVFYLRAGIDVASNATDFTHTYNRYNVSGGSTVGFSLSTGEVSSTSAMFLNQAPTDPVSWNIRPLDGSVLSSGNPSGAGSYSHDLYNNGFSTNNFISAVMFVPGCNNCIIIPFIEASTGRRVVSVQ